LEEDFILDFGRETILGHVVGVNMSWSVRLLVGIDEGGRVDVLMLTVNLGERQAI
jgi:hypothetical protein